MARSTIRISVHRAWWLTPALIAIGVYAAVRGDLPDESRLARFVMRGLRIRVEADKP